MLGREEPGLSFNCGDDALKTFLCELIGTFCFVFLAAGAVIFAGPFIGYLGISCAAGLAYAAVLSACNDAACNPALSFAALIGGKISFKGFLLSVVAQFGGAFAAAAVLSAILSGKTGFVSETGFAANVSDRYQFSAVFTTEAVLSLLFCTLYLKVRERMAAPVGLGAFLTAAYLISYPITKGALNPAKAVALATFATAEAVSELRIFCTAPFAAALIAGLFARFLTKPVKRQTAENEPSTK